MNKVLLPLVFSVMALSLIVSPAFAQITITPGENVLSIEGLKDLGGGAFINKINPDTGATISTVAITLDGSFPLGLTVTGGTGIAFNPVDGKTYALLKVSDDPGEGGGLDRHLVTIDPQTGIATLVGNTDVTKIASLTFDSGTLYAVNISDETLSTISTVDGSVDNLCDLLFGSNGSVLAFNPDDGLLYFASGDEFQRIDDFNVVGSCDVTDIGTNFDNPTALVFFNSFLISEFSDQLGLSVLFSLTTAGIDTSIGHMDHDPRGLAIIFVDLEDCSVHAEWDNPYNIGFPTPPTTPLVKADNCAPSTGFDVTDPTMECQGVGVANGIGDSKPCKIILPNFIDELDTKIIELKISFIPNGGQPQIGVAEIDPVLCHDSTGTTPGISMYDTAEPGFVIYEFECNPNPDWEEISFEIDSSVTSVEVWTVSFNDQPVGGTFIPIDQSALLLAGISSVSMWMIPVVVAGIGIGVFVIKRRN